MTTATSPDCATEFSAELLAQARANPRICIVNNDSAETHAAQQFQAEFPTRFIDVGIAEQNLVGVATGLANGGFVPFVYSAACFLTARAMDQVKVAVYSGAPVKFCSFVSGLSYGPLGGTHHAVEDLAWMRAIPGLRILAPATPLDSRAALRAALDHDGPVYLRLISKTAVLELFGDDHEFTIGSARRLRDGTDVTLIGTGLLTSRLHEAAKLLTDDGVSCRVLHMGSVSPIDETAIAEAAAHTGRIVVAEDHVLNGGLGGAVSEVVVRTVPVPVLQLGIPNVFAPIGPASYLHEYFGLTPRLLADRVLHWISGTPATGAEA